MATSVRWNLMFAACTLLGILFQKKEYDFRASGLLFLVLLFFFHNTMSTVLSEADSKYIWQRWENYFKAIIFFFVCCSMLRQKIHFEAVMCACLMSVLVIAGLDAVKFIISGGGHNINGISSTFNDNNLSALATLMCIPMCLYLLTQYKQYTLLKYILFGFILGSVMFVLGSDSRGGFLGLVVLTIYYILNSERKMFLIVMVSIIAIGALSVMGDEWFNRMDSIKSADEDSSFMGRVISWKLSLLLAIENPFFGGGFDAIIDIPTWEALKQSFDKVSFIPSPEPHIPHVAHSTYFQVLGNQGFLGIFIFALMLMKTTSSFSKVKKQAEKGSWLYHAAFFSKISIVVFMVSGAALNFAYREILLVYFAFAVCLEIVAKDNMKKEQKAVALD
ncbi:hypothetical protein XM47_13395 [Catenovulum maritimum]|uniref:O-antigen polymerase n=2 Tax=Catenovulum maritimum TaxID=1513271 RepID=A0A0J8GPD1_9ALTE|nr:hypothetical protein XM47_13395 [Catenovulum maritimum]